MFIHLIMRVKCLVDLLYSHNATSFSFMVHEFQLFQTSTAEYNGKTEHTHSMVEVLLFITDTRLLCAHILANFELYRLEGVQRAL